jgi:hypothetical protein
MEKGGSSRQLWLLTGKVQDLSLSGSAAVSILAKGKVSAVVVSLRITHHLLFGTTIRP